MPVRASTSRTCPCFEPQLGSHHLGLTTPRLQFTGSGAAKGEGYVDISALRKAAPALERLQLNDLSGAFGWVALNAGSRPDGCAPWHKLKVRPAQTPL